MMNRCLAVLLLSAVVGFGLVRTARSELAQTHPASASIFTIDGLMVDRLETDEGRKKFFRAEIQRFPLVEPKPPSARSPMRLQAPGTLPMPPHGRATDRVRAAETWAAQQEWNRALYEIQQGLDLEPNSLFLIRKGAAIAALARKFGVADEYFRRVLEAEPANVYFLAGRAGVLIRLLRFREAGECVRRALAVDPRSLSARFNETCLEVERSEKPPPRGDWEEMSARDLTEVSNWLDADRSDYVAALTEDGFKTLCDVLLGYGTAEHLKEIVDLLRKGLMSFQARQWADAEATLLKVRKLGVRVLSLDMLARCSQA
jgi:tetratricopeptide (TPR) repeat protein